jgi:hypothetical protein
MAYGQTTGYLGHDILLAPKGKARDINESNPLSSQMLGAQMGEAGLGGG